MADAGIKKVTIFRSDLPPVDATTLSYNLRYRIVTENRNRVSAWSNVVSVAAPAISTINYTVSSNNSGKIVSLVWDAPASLGLTSFDLFVRWVGNHNETDYSWAYVTRVTGNSYSLVFPLQVYDNTLATFEDPKKIRVQLQRPTYNPEREDYPTSTSLTLFQSDLITI